MDRSLGSGSRGDGNELAQVGVELFPALWRHRLLITAVTVLCAAAAYGLSHLQEPQYEATSQMILADPGRQAVFDDDTALLLDPTRYVRNQAELATSRPVLVRASERIDRRLTVEELDDLVSVRASRDLDLITVHALDATPEGAVEIADAVAYAYQDLVSADVQAKADEAIAELDDANAEIQARIDQLENAIAAEPENAALRAERDAAVAEAVSLEGRARQIAVDAALFGSGVQLFEAATLPDGPARPLPSRNSLLAGLMAFFGISAYAWWRSQRSRVADDRHDPAPILRAPLLGVVPDFEGINGNGPAPTLTGPDTAAAEAYNFVAASLLHAIGDRRGAVLLLTSPKPADGKTVSVFNIGVAIARGGRDVVMVDGDERMRGLSNWMGMSGLIGLTDMKEGRTYEECSRLYVGWAGATFTVVPAGGPIENTAGYFRSLDFREAVVELRDRGDVILFDSPPILSVADALAISAVSDGVVLVIRQGTPLRDIEDLRDRIVAAGAQILGYVFNRARDRGSRGAYGYEYYGYSAETRRGSTGNGQKDRRPNPVRSGKAGGG
jgi:Mrp family chromosome partitioning ATPase/capsular polysaccharide biosynthesis protein